MVSLNVNTPGLDKAHHALCDTLVAWNDLEVRLGDKGVPPIDSNYIGHKTDLAFNSREDVISAFEALREQMAVAGDAMTAKRIGCFLTYIDYTRHPELYTLRDYFAAMTDIKLQYYPESKVTQARQVLEEKLSDLNIPFENASVLIRTNEPALRPQRLGRLLRRNIDLDLAEFFRMTGIQSKPNYKIRTVQSPKIWKGWLSGNANGEFLMRFNETTIKHMGLYYLTYLARHEILGHAVMESLLIERVKHKHVPKSHGITTIASFEMVHAEALAETAGLLLRSRDNPLESAYRSFIYYARMVDNNAYLIDADEGTKAAHEYCREHPAINFEDTVKEIKAVASKDPQVGLYMPLYAPVNNVMTRACNILGYTKFGQMLGELYPDWQDAAALNRAIAARGIGHTALNLV